VTFGQHQSRIFLSFGHSQVITQAARAIPATSTLIDHIAVTNKNNFFKAGVTKTTFCDQYVC